MDVENIDALNPAELDALLERALDPQVPVEVFYAVLERIGPHEPSAEAAPPQAGADAPGPAWTARAGQTGQHPSPGTQPANGAGTQTTTSPPLPQPVPLTLPAPGSQAPAPATHPQAAQGTGTTTAHQQSNAQSVAAAQQASIGRRAAQHGPPPRGFVVPVSDTEATTVMRAITGVDGGTRANPVAAAVSPSPDTAASPTAQTTMMPAVPASETDERPEKPSR